MEQRYLRNIGALTEVESDLLHTKKVCVVGCGGLGGHAIDMLLRIGIGNLTAIDGDVFEETNLNRQLLSDEQVLGFGKAEIAAKHAALVNSGVAFRGIHKFLTQENCCSLLIGYDAVIDALDNIESRKILAHGCAELGIPLIHGAVRGWYAQVTVVLPGEKLIEILFPENVKISDKTCLSFTPAFCAALQVAECVKLLCGRPVPLHGKLISADLLQQEFYEVPLDTLPKE